METGVVVFWNSERGFGFVRPEGGTRADDVFVHAHALQGRGDLEKGQKVRFDVEATRDGRVKAANVEVLAYPDGRE